MWWSHYGPPETLNVLRWLYHHRCSSYLWRRASTNQRITWWYFYFYRSLHIINFPGADLSSNSEPTSGYYRWLELTHIALSLLFVFCNFYFEVWIINDIKFSVKEKYSFSNIKIILFMQLGFHAKVSKDWFFEEYQSFWTKVSISTCTYSILKF